MPTTIPDPESCYRAVVARDRRYDGVFFTCVKTTGIYCRPICPARTPGRDRCVFVASAVEAERAGFRACLRCKPNLAPGHASVDALRVVAGAASRHIADAALDGGTVGDVARAVGVSGRQLRRAVRAELGTSPVALAQTRRLDAARRLVAETALPITDVAFASGFRSLRRFNAAFRARYGCAPTSVRGRGFAPPAGPPPTRAVPGSGSSRGVSGGQSPPPIRSKKGSDEP